MLPLSFGSSVLNEGSFAQLSCVVSEGDEPLTLSWSFHGHNLTSDLGISTTDLGTRTSILMIPSVAHKHVGNYTCKAINSAGYASNTAELKVNGRLQLYSLGKEREKAPFCMCSKVGFFDFACRGSRNSSFQFWQGDLGRGGFCSRFLYCHPR